jgi:hypothetical protein
MIFPHLAGCGYTQGAALYMLGFGKTKMVEAQFRLTENPILILVDDPGGHLIQPGTRGHIADELAQQLLRTKAAKKIVPPRTLDQLRQTTPDFAKIGAREIGEMAGAEQVLWIEVQEYFADEQFTAASDAAHAVVTLRVINVLEKDQRSRVRAWPTMRSGMPATAGLSGSDAARLKTTDAISMELATRLAVEIARFFHDYRPGDFDK